MQVTRTYLELPSRAALAPVPRPAGALRLERLRECPPSFYRYLYAEVGRAYRWVDRLSWDAGQINRHLARCEVSVHLLSVSGAPAGYFEIERHLDGSAEIAYFGLLPEFHRRGLGKWLLQEAVDAALAASSRVWLHTCTLDDPAALPNYLARGFRPVRTEICEVAP